MTMRGERKRILGTSEFIIKYPVLFSIIVVTGVELVMIFSSDYSLTKLADESLIKAVGMYCLKVVVMLVVVYTYLYHKRNALVRKQSSE